MRRVQSGGPDRQLTTFVQRCVGTILHARWVLASAFVPCGLAAFGVQTFGNVRDAGDDSFELVAVESAPEIPWADVDVQVAVARTFDGDRPREMSPAHLALLAEALEEAEQQLEELRIRTVSSPADQDSPIRVREGLTRDPVFSHYFQRRVELEQVNRDIRRIELLLIGAESEALRSGGGEQPLRALLADLEARRIRLDAEIGDLDTRLKEVPPDALEERRLMERVRNLERLYEETRADVEAARRTSTTGSPQVRVLTLASAPTSPSRDVRLPIALGVLIGCLALAVCTALFLDGVRPPRGMDPVPLLAIAVGAMAAIAITARLLFGP